MPAPAKRTLLRRLVDWSCDLNAVWRRVPQIEPLAALRLLHDEPANTIWIDVRAEAEQQVSMIDRAWTAEQALARIEELQENGDKQIVAYCTAGFRSGSFVAKLKRLGVPAQNLRGGLFAWCDAQGPLVDRDGKATRRVHTYAKYCQFVPDDYDPVA